MMRALLRGPLGLAMLLSAALPAGAAAPVPGRSALNGVWKIAQPRSTLVHPADVPFTPAGRRGYLRNKAAAASGDFAFDPTMDRCSSPGMPRIMLTDRPFKIFVRADVTSMMFEWNRLLRQIDMRGSPSARDWGTMMGDAWGSWDGNALMIESRNFDRVRLLDGLIPNSDQLHLSERLTLVDGDTLEDRVTITDPEMFTRPWETTLTYKRQPDQTFAEDVCLDRRAAGQAPWPAPRVPARGAAR